MRNLDLALIGNCTLGALIDERAEMVWACFPRSGQYGRMFRPMSLINSAIRLSVRWDQAF